MNDQSDLKDDFDELISHRRDQMASKPQKLIQPPPDENLTQRVIRLSVQAVAGGLASVVIIALIFSASVSGVVMCLLPFAAAAGVTLIGRGWYKQPGSFA